MLNSKDLQQFINQRQLNATILHLDEDTPTVPDAARVLGVAPEQIIKSLVFLVKGEAILVIANGVKKVDPRKLAQHFQVGRKRIKFASAERALDITGYVVGSMPPFGHKTPLPTYVDEQVTKLSEVYGGGGDLHAMCKLNVSQLPDVTGAEIMSLVEED